MFLLQPKRFSVNVAVDLKERYYMKAQILKTKSESSEQCFEAVTGTSIANAVDGNYNETLENVLAQSESLYLPECELETPIDAGFQDLASRIVELENALKAHELSKTIGNE